MPTNTTPFPPADIVVGLLTDMDISLSNAAISLGMERTTLNADPKY